MSNPFLNRSLSLSGPATDAVPVTPNDSADLSDAAIALYVETGGTLVINTIKGTTRTLQVDDFSILPLGTIRVLATGTTATGIHAMVLV